MTADPDSTPHGVPNRRTPVRLWVAIGVAAVIGVATLLLISHRPGLPTLVPGQKGPAHMARPL